MNENQRKDLVANRKLLNLFKAMSQFESHKADIQIIPLIIKEHGGYKLYPVVFS